MLLKLQLCVTCVAPLLHTGRFSFWISTVSCEAVSHTPILSPSNQYGLCCPLPFLQLADLNRRLPAEAGMPPSKPGPLRPRETPPPPRPSPHTITLQPPAFRNLRLPKRLRVVYFLARTRLAQRIIMVRRPRSRRRCPSTGV